MSTRSELKKAVEDARIDYDNALDAHRATQVTYAATRAVWFTAWEAFKDSEDKRMSDPKERLIRIMGTFDLATGHADGWDDLLDSLESELRDVLGHYRQADKEEFDAWRKESDDGAA